MDIKVIDQWLTNQKSFGLAPKRWLAARSFTDYDDEEIWNFHKFAITFVFILINSFLIFDEWITSTKRVHFSPTRISFCLAQQF